MSQKSSIKFSFNRNKFDELISSTFRPRLKRVGIHLRKKIVRKIGVPFREKDGTTLRYDPKRQGTPATEGDPPRKDLGLLQKSIFYVVDESELTVEVGTTVEYGLHLEVSHPYLRTTLTEETDEIARIMTEKR